MTVKHILIAIGIGCCTQAMAQARLTTFVKKVGTLIDSMSVRGLDRSYIDAPEKPWQLIAKVLDSLEHDFQEAFPNEPPIFLQGFRETLFALVTQP